MTPIDESYLTALVAEEIATTLPLFIQFGATIDTDKTLIIDVNRTFSDRINCFQWAKIMDPKENEQKIIDHLSEYKSVVVHNVGALKTYPNLYSALKNSPIAKIVTSGSEEELTELFGVNTGNADWKMDNGYVGSKKITIYSFNDPIKEDIKNVLQYVNENKRGR